MEIISKVTYILKVDPLTKQQELIRNIITKHFLTILVTIVVYHNILLKYQYFSNEKEAWDRRATSVVEIWR